MKTKTSQTTVFNKGILSIVENEILFNGHLAKLEALHVPAVALIIPITSNNEFVLVQQYRHTFDKLFYEFPAGKLNEDETPIVAAHREVLEETGIFPHELTLLGTIASSPEYTDEIVYVYKTTSFTEGQPSQEYYEDITTTKLSEKDLISYITSGKINDSKTIAAYMLYLLMTKKPHQH